MNLTEDVLRVHGGLSKNNLSDTLHLNEDEDDANNIFANFTLSHYYDEESIKDYCKGNKGGLNIISLNTESAFKKIEMINALIITLKNKYNFIIHVISLQEGWINENSPTSLLKIANYTPHIKYNGIGGQKGGMVIFVHDSLSGKEETFFSPSPNKLWEGHALTLTGGILQKPVKLYSVYRPPREKKRKRDVDNDDRNNHDIFMSEFEPYLEKIKNNNHESIIVGDFNYNLIESNSNPMCQEYFDAMIMNEFLPQITLPTKINRNSCKLYDHIFVNMRNTTSHTNSCIYVTNISDHLPVFLSLHQKSKQKIRPKYIEKRVFSTKNQELFLELTAKQLPNTYFDPYLTSNPTPDFNKLDNILAQNFDKVFPIKRVKVNKYNHKDSPWITQGILKSIKTRDNLYKKLIKTKPTNPSYHKKEKCLKDHKALLSKLLRKTKREYYAKQFELFSNDCKKTWKLLHQITGAKAKKSELPSYFKKYLKSDNGKTIETKIYNDKSIANEFNKYFVNIGPKLSANIKYCSKKTVAYYLFSPTKSRFHFDLVSDKQVLDHMMSIKPKDSSGIDNISSKLLIQLAPMLHPILALLINKSLMTGIFPDKLKVAIVTPIYKGKNTDQHEFGNYRPISVLPAMSKIFEKVVHSQIYEYMNKKKFLNRSQYGFRAKHSTEYATIEFVEKAAKSLDNSHIPFSVFIDLSKAFDTLDHAILFKKLQYYGIHGTELEWFKNYLTDRTQYVTYNKTLSSAQYLTTGVPQGSVLGPLLFLIYINDISNASKLFEAILFADDTNLFSTMNMFYTFTPKTKYDMDILSNRINKELEKIYEWLQINKLSLNVDKTKYMIFHSKQKNIAKYGKLDLKINDKSIQRTNSFNFLGIIINENLNWNDHITFISNKINPVVGLLNRLKNQLPTHILKMIYNSLILSRLHYGNIIWGHHPGSLIRLNKKALRAMANTGSNAHSNVIEKKLKLLSLPDIHKMKLLCFYKRYIELNLPYNLHAMFDNINILNTPVYPRTALYRNTVHFSLPTFMATVEDELITRANKVSYGSYKYSIKKYFFNTYSSLCTQIGCKACSLVPD